MRSQALAASESRRFATGLAAGLILLVLATFVIDYLPVFADGLTVTLDDFGTVLAALAATLMCLAASGTSADRRSKLGWGLLAAGFGCSAVAEFIWFAYESIAHIESPFPSFTDVFYLALYPLAFAGILMLARPSMSGVRRAVMAFDSLLFTMSLSGLAWQLILAPTYAASTTLSRLGTALSLAYPAADLLLLFSLATLFLSWDLRRVHTSALWLLGGMLVMVAADLGFAWQVGQGAYDSSSVVDPLWTVSYSLVAIGALVHVRVQRTPTADEDVVARPTLNLERSGLIKLALPYVALPAAGALIVLHLRESGGAIGTSAILVLAYAILLLCLVLARQFVTLIENTRLGSSLAERTDELHMLNHVATALSQCLTTEDALRTGLHRATAALRAEGGAVWLREDARPRLATVWYAPANEKTTLFERLTDDEATIGRVIGPRVSVLLPRGDLDLVEPDDRLRDHRLVIVPLTSRGAVLGSLGLILTSQAADDGPARRLLEALGAQLGVAVGNAQLYEHARSLAERDSLTNLLNHRAFQTRLEEECDRERDEDESFAVVMMDLDGFKILNDTFGHQGGDDALRLVAGHLKEYLRATDVLGRYGGDEFVALLPHTDEHTARALCERLRDGLTQERHITQYGPLVRLRLSFGIACCPRDACAAHALVGIADHNLYASKRCGGDRITVAGDATCDGELTPLNPGHAGRLAPES